MYITAILIFVVTQEFINVYSSVAMVNDFLLHLATENLHDDSEQYIITFAPGVTRVLFDALIIDQITISDNKYYRLIIDHSLLPDGVTTYYPDEASVIAIDNCKCIILT